MSVVGKVKSILGMADQEANTYRCNECDNTFDAHAEPDSAWLSCPECDSRDVSVS